MFGKVVPTDGTLPIQEIAMSLDTETTKSRDLTAKMLPIIMLNGSTLKLVTNGLTR